ncbi:hypothetical protein [Streptomyces parvulus]|uniref:hypothetical protein n=1 Tax=Streptomyces parvulus TaxID=146923 RepID=UPI00210EB91D|nr:hypothetical protein [Streptomyces parvulus]MCQ4194446.1 hypothetical protein [Streptomyces parvulus]
MNTTPRPLKSVTAAPDGPRAAAQPVDTTAVGEPKGAARQGVVIALRADPQPVTVAGITPGLQIRTRGVPVADWLCACGHHERARGKAAVTELQARVRVAVCPHTAVTEGRTAA